MRYLILILLIFLVSCNKIIEAPKEMKLVREPAVAGAFYPSNKEELKLMVKGFLDNAKKNLTNVYGLVVPHAGYIYSGQVAAEGFKQLDGAAKVIVIAPSHYVRFYGASIPNVTHYKTPLGEIKISPLAQQLLKEPLIISSPQVHKNEHAIEVELPFLQLTLKEFELIPIVTGIIEPKELAEILIKYIDDSTVIVASSDFSHYYPYDVAIKLDNNCIKAIPTLNFSLMERCEACGKIPVLTLMHIASSLGWKGKFIDYKNSGDTAGTKDRVVGYIAVAFYKEVITEEEKEFLLKLARTTLNEYLTKKTLPIVNEGNLSENLKRVSGCFVTLKKFGMLRGCIGHILPREPLYKCVIDNAINAALHDIRFNPVSYEELKDIKIEISVLTQPKRLKYNNPEELLNKLKPLKDGVVIKQGFYQSTYLPQVWEQLPNKIDFLTNLCRKAGLALNCWQDPNTIVETYNAIVFEEH